MKHHNSATPRAVSEQPRGDHVPIRESNAEHVGNARLAVIDEPNAEHHRLGFERVRRSEAADVASMRACLGRQIPRNLDAVDVIRRSAGERAVIDIVHVPPELAVLAPAVSAEVRHLESVGDNPAAAGDEVARYRHGGALADTLTLSQDAAYGYRGQWDQRCRERRRENILQRSVQQLPRLLPYLHLTTISRHFALLGAGRLPAPGTPR